MNKNNNGKPATLLDKKFDRKVSLIITGLIIINLISRLFEPLIIGHNSRYTLYFFAAPVATGIIYLAYRFRKMLAYEYRDCKLWSDKILVPAFFLLMGLFLAYLTFGWAGNLTWLYLNEKAAQKNQTETVTCRVSKFSNAAYRSGGAKIFFIFQNRQESFSISNASYSAYKNSSPQNFQLKIEGRKGLWNYFIVDHYEVEKTDQ